MEAFGADAGGHAGRGARAIGSDNRALGEGGGGGGGNLNAWITMPSFRLGITRQNR